jgi:hypothetical protein
MLCLASVGCAWLLVDGPVNGACGQVVGKTVYGGVEDHSVGENTPFVCVA